MTRERLREGRSRPTPQQDGSQDPDQIQHHHTGFAGHGPGFVEWLLAQRGRNLDLFWWGRELASDPPRARNIRTLAELDATLDGWDAIPLVRRAVYGLWREYRREVAA